MRRQLREQLQNNNFNKKYFKNSIKKCIELYGSNQPISVNALLNNYNNQTNDKIDNSLMFNYLEDFFINYWENFISYNRSLEYLDQFFDSLHFENKNASEEDIKKLTEKYISYKINFNKDNIFYENNKENEMTVAKYDSLYYFI